VAISRLLVDARYAALGTPDDDGGFDRFITAGMTDDEIEPMGPLPRDEIVPRRPDCRLTASGPRAGCRRTIQPMPFYEFACPTCEERFEVQRPMSERDEPTPCPNGHESAKRIVSNVGVSGGIRYGGPAAAARQGTLGSSVSSPPKDAPKVKAPD